MNGICKTKSKRKKHCNLVDSVLSCRGTGQQSWYCYTCLFVLNDQMDGTWVYTLFLCSVSWKGLKEMILLKSERNYNINLWLEELVMHVLNQGMEILSPRPTQPPKMGFPTISLSSLDLDPLHFSFLQQIPQYTKNNFRKLSPERNMPNILYINSWVHQYYAFFVVSSSFFNF